MTEDVMDRFLESLRDDHRPNIHDVVDVIKSGFMRMQVEVLLEHDGPDMWMWSDAVSLGLNMPRYFILGRSTLAGAEGYPLFTIRQCVSLALDSWIVGTALVVGPDTNGILRSLTIALANHNAMFAAFKYATARMAATEGDPMGALRAAEAIMAMTDEVELDPELTALSRPTDGSMN